MSIDLTYGSLRRMRADERKAADTLIERQPFSDDDKELIRSMLFGPISQPKAKTARDTFRGDWCPFHLQARKPRAGGNGYRCNACEREYVARRRAKEAS